MTFFRSLLVLCPAAVLLAQNPSTQPPSGPKPAANQPNASPAAPSTPAANPFVTPGSSVPATPAVPPDKVVIAVGDTKITYAQYEALIGSLPEQYRAAARGAGRVQFANQIVKVLVLAEEGKRRKLDDNPGYRAQVAFQNANVLAGLTFEDINKSKPDDAQVQKFYDAHKSDFETIRARHILIRMQGSSVPLQTGQKDLTDAEALAKTQEIRKKIVDGADFSALAKAESDDTSSKANGGDLGSFGRGRMVGPFDEAAFALKIGELSEPVKTPFGYHIIKVEERKAKTLEEARQEVETRVKAEYLEQLQTKSNVVIDPELFGTATQ
jgi:peptidyl-prolyl cis-trans isomerase C